MDSKHYRIFPLPRSDGRVSYVAAGPTRAVFKGVLFVRLAEELPEPKGVVKIADLSVPDFQPLDAEKACREIPRILEYVDSGALVYAGCAGGIGRTGTFLAALAAYESSALRVGNAAVAYVRQHYWSSAVETIEQANAVRDVAARVEERDEAASRKPARERTLIDRILGR